MSYLERLRSFEISHTQVFIAGAVLRMALFALPEVVMMLQRRPELSTPITSFRSSKSALLISSMMTLYGLFSPGRCLHLSARLKSLLRRYFLPRTFPTDAM